MPLHQEFTLFAQWRHALINEIGQLQKWLQTHDLLSSSLVSRFSHLSERLQEDRLLVAFVAEFSRGKSELINALFFSDYGNRILPSSIGRTTMCPTELFYDRQRAHGIELLPIETRAGQANVSDYRNQREAWLFHALDINSAQSMQQALEHVSETIRVPVEEARRLGFEVSEQGQGGSNLYRCDADNLVEIPRWRHALINFPHPLLQQGLVILDTPGLNAVGAEPELTLSLLPSAHAVLFVLAADTGVTQSDLQLWQEHICAQADSRRTRLVALNKIDGQWDDLRSEAEIEQAIRQQVENCSQILSLPAGQIYPVSAKKALVARVNKDNELLQRSRILPLENALSKQMLPRRRDIVREGLRAELCDVREQTRSLLAARLANIQEQLNELNALKGKNKGVVEYMMGKIRGEREEFEQNLKRYYAIRSVFTQHANQIISALSVSQVRKLTQNTRTIMLDARFSRALSEAMTHYFQRVEKSLHKAEKEISEIYAMMSGVYKKFHVEHGFKLATVPPFSLAEHRNEIEVLREWCEKNINTTFNLITQDKQRIVQKFFEEIAIQVRRFVEKANRDSEAWLQKVMSPLESQVREYELQLKRRMESIKRIHQATDSLEERIAEIKDVEIMVSRQMAEFKALEQKMDYLLQSEN